LANSSIERLRVEHQSDICPTRSKPNPRVEHQILFETQLDDHTRFDFKIVYRSEKTKEKSSALTRRSKELSKKENDTNERSKYQHQTILKIENSDKEVAKSYLRFIFLILIFLDDVEINANKSDSHLEKSQLDENLINLEKNVLTHPF
jgi:hypothetical protein